MQSFRRLGLAIVVALLAVNVAALMRPCPDDLLVALGAPDQCVGQTPDDSSEDADSPASCPCACHVQIATGPPIPVAPTLIMVELETLKPLGVLTAIPTPITPPPLA